jgi:hypothetical protein
LKIERRLNYSTLAVTTDINPIIESNIESGYISKELDVVGIGVICFQLCTSCFVSSVLSDMQGRPLSYLLSRPSSQDS